MLDAGLLLVEQVRGLVFLVEQDAEKLNHSTRPSASGSLDDCSVSTTSPSFCSFSFTSGVWLIMVFSMASVQPEADIRS